MKNIFGVDITNNNQNDTADGAVFITKNTDPILIDKIDEHNKATNKITKKLYLPDWANAIRVICLMFAFVMTSSILLGTIVFGFSKSYSNGKILYFICAGLWIILAVLSQIGKMNSKKFSESDEYSDYTKQSDAVIKELHNHLGIPENHKKIDVLFFKYKIKNEKTIRLTFSSSDFINFEYMMYIKNEDLCLANEYNVISIPLNSIKSITKCKTASFLNWNKKDDHNSKEYKKYKIFYNNKHSYTADYYSVLIEDPKGEFELFIPNYDIETFSQLTRVRIDE